MKVQIFHTRDIDLFWRFLFQISRPQHRAQPFEWKLSIRLCTKKEKQNSNEEVELTEW